MSSSEYWPGWLSRHVLAFGMTLLLVAPAFGQIRVLKYEPSPPDNPLRGLVPYSGDKRDKFPHSLEFNYVPLNELMVGRNTFDWKPLEKLLDDVASRGHQLVLRIWMEYPGKNGIPKFLIDDGIKVTEWLNTNTDPFPRQKCWTPDYEDPRTRAALKSFIAAFGERYDGDPRLGFLTAGLLGTWGEWHCYPRTELFASKPVQTEVLDAFAAAFDTTPVLLRYPAGDSNYHYAPTHKHPFGYHDDSFAWATLDTGRKNDAWYFVPALRDAAADAAWKRHPIGGEIRPELWGQIFDEKPAHKNAQDFAECVNQTHASWLLDTGMFGEPQPAARVSRAIQQVQKMGYEFHVSSIAIVEENGNSNVVITVRNTGVAPFYYDWPIEIGVLDRSQWRTKSKTNWKLTELLPRETRVWKIQLQDIPQSGLAIRVVNPLKGGLPLRFANEGQAQSKTGWLKLR